MSRVNAILSNGVTRVAAVGLRCVAAAFAFAAIDTAHAAMIEFVWVDEASVLSGQSLSGGSPAPGAFSATLSVDGSQSGSTINLTSNTGLLTFSVGGTVALNKTVSFTSTALTLASFSGGTYLATPPTSASAFSGSSMGSLGFTAGYPSSSVTLSGIANAADVLNLTELPAFAALASTFGVSPVNALFALASGSGNITLSFNVLTHALSAASTGVTSYAYDFGYWKPAVVPLPATVWLMGSALLALLGFRRRPSRPARYAELAA